MVLPRPPRLSRHGPAYKTMSSFASGEAPPARRGDGQAGWLGLVRKTLTCTVDGMSDNTDRIQKTDLGFPMSKPIEGRYGGSAHFQESSTLDGWWLRVEEYNDANEGFRCRQTGAPYTGQITKASVLLDDEYALLLWEDLGALLRGMGLLP